MADIRPPEKKNPGNPIASAAHFPKPGKLSNFKAYWPIILGALFLGLVFGISDFAQSVKSGTALIRSEINNIQTAASNLQLSEIKNSADIINVAVQKIFSKSKSYGIYYLSKSFSNLISNTSQFSENAFLLTQNLKFLEENGAGLIINQKGQELIARLENLEINLDVIEKDYLLTESQLIKSKFLIGGLASFSQILEKNNPIINFNLRQSKEFIAGLLDIFKQENDRHFLIIFQNESEIRPAGGFIGSYGNLILNQGNLKNIEVGDIYNADRQLDIKLIPPKELQNITKNWGARDANWFFDFPTSAQKVISLLEQSRLYSENKTRFDGAIALNTKVLGTILEITGPIPVPDYGLTIDSQNYLPILQSEIEAGRDKKPGQNPKKILSVLAPLLLEKLSAPDSRQKELLQERLKKHLAGKDVMLYFQDWRLQNVLENLGIAGDVLKLPENFGGDYLAVVNANIAGGKTDAFIQQKIILKSEIAADGKIFNKLTVSRAHAGEKETDWWYATTNKNYLKILVPGKSRIISLSGNTAYSLKNKIIYPKEYDLDPDLFSIEKTASFMDKFQTWVGKEFGKTSFGTWFNTPAGTEKELTVAYENGVTLNIQDSQQYQFIFEKQSGSDSSLEYSISAPPGYIWKESGSELFKYETDQIKSREIINLTLKKI